MLTWIEPSCLPPEQVECAGQWRVELRGGSIKQLLLGPVNCALAWVELTFLCASVGSTGVRVVSGILRGHLDTIIG